MTTTRDTRATAPNPVDAMLDIYDVTITPEHEARFQQIREWTATFVSLSKQIAGAQKTLAYTRQQEPRQPREIVDLREWAIYEIRLARHQESLSVLEDQLTRLSQQWAETSVELFDALPWRVWFKINDLAVGIECDDDVDIAPAVVVMQWGTHASYHLDRRGLKI